MGVALIVVGHPLLQEAKEMTFVPRNHEVKALSSKCPNTPFTDRIRHRRPHRCFEHAQSHMSYALIHLVGKNRIAIMDQKPVSVIDRNRLSELL